MMRPFAAIAVCVLGSMACRSTPATSCAPPRAIESSNWPIDSASAFRIRIPPGFQRQPAQGIDSEGGGWTSPRGTVTYDYGAYSGPLTDGPYATGEACSIPVGGRPARFVLARAPDGRFHLGVHWTGLPESGFGPVKLTITAVTTDSLVRDTLAAMLWTVTFKN